MIDPHELAYRTARYKMIITASAGLLTIWGILAVYRTQALTGLWPHYPLRQLLYAAVAWILFALAVQIRFKTLCRLALPLAALGAAVMAALPLGGMRINGMRGWYELGFVTLQPSELIKGIFLLYLIRVLYMRQLPPFGRLFAALGGIGCMALLLLIQPDFGTMMVYVLSGIAALYLSKVKLKTLLILTISAIPMAITAIILHPYMRNRILHFLNPELDPGGGSWHLRQFAIAIARGEFTGVKGAQAVWSNSFLPLAHNDSVFAALCEMQGFLGGVLLLMLYGMMFFNIYRLAQLQLSPWRRSLIDSINAMLIIQTLLHILVNTGLIPPTGITLVLISYGGSSLLGTMLMLAIVMIAGRTSKA